MGALRVLFLCRGRLYGPIGGALSCECVVGAGVIDEVLILEVQNAADRAVQKLPVVADDQHGVRVFDKVGFEPERAFQVEIVGRLVQEQQVGFTEQHGGQSHAHPPAAGKGRAGHLLFFMGKPQTTQDGGGTRFGGPCFDIGQPRLHLGDAGRVSGGFGLGQKGFAFGIGAQDGVDERHLVARHLLADPSDLPTFGNGHIAGIQHHLAPDHPEKRGLARAVAPHKAHLVTGGNGDSRMFDQGAAIDGVGDVGNLEHGAAMIDSFCGVNQVFWWRILCAVFMHARWKAPARYLPQL